MWGTRIWNIWGDDHGVGFKVVHTVLAAVSIAFAIALLRIARRYMSRRSEAQRVSS